MLAMNSPIPTSKPPRRFLLLPDREADVSGREIRVRRYRLVTISPRVPSSR
jgi:hypothetical protein